jgi:xanthine dehydrogenase molybdopterin-binding subunit B
LNITPISNFTGFIDLQGRPNDSGALVKIYNDGSATTLLATGTSESSGKYTTAYQANQYLVEGVGYYIFVDRDLFLPTPIWQLPH